MRLVIVDDDDVFRTSLWHLLGDDPRIEIAGVADDLQSALAVVADGVDTVLVDVLLGQKSGFEVVAELRRKNDRLVLLMMSGLDASEYEHEARAAGAHGIVTKTSFVGNGVEALIAAVAAVRG